jgi:predicted MPP superfamily phosphohydrolase
VVKPSAIALAALLLTLGLLDACWLERRVFLVRDDVRLEIPRAPALRFVQLSDLHIAGDYPLLHKLLDRVGAVKPDVILISGDLIQDVPDREETARHTAVAAAFVAGLRRAAPVIAVQGHSEYDGTVLSTLDRAGAAFLSNEGRRIGQDGGLLLLGLNQQVGDDAYTRRWKSPFRMLRWQGTKIYSVTHGEPFRNSYSHWDPQPAGLADEGGPLAWSGYDTLCDTWIDNDEVGSGIAVHSRFVLGEDRMYRLRRARAENGQPGSFFLVAHGTTLTGKVDTGVDPQPKRWYRLRLRTEVQPGVVRLRAKAWPLDRPEPRDWQAVAEDRGPHRVESGTVGLWGWGGGTVLYKNLQVTDAQGVRLLDAPLTGPQEPEGFRKGTRGTRLTMAISRSPYRPPGTPRIVLSHTPDVALEASTLGIEAVIAGHTHGGQVRLPFFGALTTRNTLGPYYDYGRYEFAAPNARGLTTLFINGGIGTSVLPIRFWCPPRWAVIEVGAGESP